MNRLLRTNYSGTPKDKIGPFATNCCTKLTGNTLFPDAAPYVTAIQEAQADYQALASIKNPIPEQTAQMLQYRRVLDGALSAAAKYANDKYPANEAALLSTGFELSKPREKRTALPPPKKFELHDGTEPDTLCAKVVRATGAVATEVRYTTDPTLPWYEWKSVVTTRSSVLLRGYQKKDEVFAMFRSVGGDTDDQPFSDAISRVVQ